MRKPTYIYFVNASGDTAVVFDSVEREGRYVYQLNETMMVSTFTATPERLERSGWTDALRVTRREFVEGIQKIRLKCSRFRVDK